MLDYKCTLRNPKRCAFFPKCVYSDNFDQPMSTTQNPNQYICLCTSFKFYLDIQSWHDFFSKSVAHLQSALCSCSQNFSYFLICSLSMDETDDSSKTDPESDLSRAVTANKLFPPGIDDDK